MMWEQADRISDAIVDMLRKEIDATDSHPLEMLAGQLLAFKAFLRTAPLRRPVELHKFEEAVDLMLDIVRTKREREK